MYTLEYLESLPTLVVGQDADLKIEKPCTYCGKGVVVRIWLSRCGVEDGEPYPNKVTVEELRDGVWSEVGYYKAR